MMQKRWPEEPPHERPSKYEYKQKVITPPPTISTLFPNFDRWAIGFDPLLATLREISRETRVSTYPPYNLRKEGEQYVLELAVAGFSKEDIDITVQELSLTVEGKLKDDPEGYIHKGIAGREFKQNFALAEYVVVKSAELKDGLLKITLEQELPEEKRPKSIKIR